MLLILVEMDFCVFSLPLPLESRSSSRCLLVYQRLIVCCGRRRSEAGRAGLIFSGSGRLLTPVERGCMLSGYGIGEIIVLLFFFFYLLLRAQFLFAELLLRAEGMREFAERSCE